MSDITTPRKQLRPYVVRQTCDYSIRVDAAESEEDAIKQAEEIDLDDWAVVWSGVEAEEDL